MTLAYTGAAYGVYQLADGLFSSDDEGGTDFKDLKQLSQTATNANRISDLLFGGSSRQAFADFIGSREPLSRGEKQIGRGLDRMPQEIPGIREQLREVSGFLDPLVRQGLESGFLDKEFDITPFDQFQRRRIQGDLAGILGNRLSGLRSSGTNAETQQLFRDNALALAAKDADIENNREIVNAQLRQSFFPQGANLAARLPTLDFEFGLNASRQLSDALRQERFKREEVRPGAAPPVPSIFDQGGAVQGLGTLESLQQYVGEAPNQGAGLGGTIGSLLGSPAGGALLSTLGNAIVPGVGGLLGAGVSALGGLFGPSQQGNTAQSFASQGIYPSRNEGFSQTGIWL